MAEVGVFDLVWEEDHSHMIMCGLPEVLNFWLGLRLKSKYQSQLAETCIAPLSCALRASR